MSDAPTHDSASHYDRVTAAWTLLLGDDLHYGLFPTETEDLSTATGELTRLMIESACLEPGHRILDVGCGTGAPASLLARTEGVHVTGITTSVAGVAAARARAGADGVADMTAFEQRDGMDNGYSDGSFDRVWALESSHLMRRRDDLIAECARVLKPGGRFVLCDIVRRRELGLDDVRRLREPLALLRAVFGDARMEPLAEYRRLAALNGLRVERETDLTPATRPTFGGWRRNAARHREEVVTALGEDELRQFVEACDVLERFWDDGILGYGLLVAVKPADG